ncbi:MAG TPA: T9SS type A sorting domain-containing protein [Candidatus Krumholzibacteria bacterium]|nr:T9SS type A sorting domain-containing protein [Candidatus Krumholzibacteria bacterium]
MRLRLRSILGVSFTLLLVAASAARAQVDPDSLYRSVHPRLAFTRADVLLMRARIHDGGADDAAYATIRTYATSLYPLQSLSHMMSVSYGLGVAVNCGLVSFLDDTNPRVARDAGRRFTLALADSFQADSDPFYTSIRLRCLCYGYDTCMDDATQNERAYVRGEIESYVDSMMVAFNFERWLHPPYVSNKTAMTGAALGIAAICLADEMGPARVSAALARADTFVNTWIRYHLDPDGACFEGVQYGAWAMSHLAWYFEARRRYDGVDYSKRSDIRKIERWLAYETLPEHGGVVNNLNDTSYLNHPLSRENTYLEWAMASWKSGVSAWLWDRMLGPDGYDAGALQDHAATVLWHRAVAPVDPGTLLPRSLLWKERGLYYYRSGWPSHGSDSDDVVFTFYAGPFHGGHSQEDQGSFTLYAYGSRFAADNGFDAPNARSEAHNLVFIDGKGQHHSGSSVGTDGVMRAHVLTPYADYLLGDATTAYTTYSPYNAPGVPFPDDDWSYGYFGANPVEYAQREWLVVHDGVLPPCFILIDDVKKDESSHTYQWRMHTDGTHTVDLGANPVRIDGTRGSMLIDLLHPAFDTVTRGIEAFDNTSVDPDTRVITLSQGAERGLFMMVLRPSGSPAATSQTTSYPWGGMDVIEWPGATDIVVAHAPTDTVAVDAPFPGGTVPIRTDARVAHIRRRGSEPVRAVLVRATTCDVSGTPLLRSHSGPVTVIQAGAHAYIDRSDANFRLYGPGVQTLQAGDTLLTFRRDGDYIVRDRTPSAAGTIALRVYPLPATTRTTLVVEMGEAGTATVDIFDVAGRRVRSLWNGPLQAGRTLLPFDGRDDLAHRLSSGVYFARVRAAGRVATGKIVWVR